jgi:hypothetical protein
MRNENELIIDDKKIDLPDGAYANIDKTAFSSDGKTLLIAARYNPAYYETKPQHKGNYLFFYQDGVIVKELTLPNDV